jgi:hypothetical protein
MQQRALATSPSCCGTRGISPVRPLLERALAIHEKCSTDIPKQRTNNLAVLRARPGPRWARPP